MRIGVISDTHGLLRPEALSALHGVSHIIHAGDIGNAQILQTLQALAPVSAVRGNNDRADWACNLSDRESLQLLGHTVLVLHDLSELHSTVIEGVSVVISGHSHRPKIERRKGVLYLNPGSAGPRRFSLPVSVAILELERTTVAARVIELKIDSSKRPRKASRPA